MGTEHVVRCPHGYTWPYCPWGCTVGRPEWKDPFEYENVKRRRERSQFPPGARKPLRSAWPPTKVPDLDAAVEERDLIVRLRQARQELWALVASWEVRPELREAARDLTAVLESYDE